MTDTESNIEETAGSISNCSQGSRGTRGTSWTRREITALLRIWGEAELRFCVSSLRRNYHIFSYISEQLSKVQVYKTPNEARSKTKRLRSQYKRAKAQNSRSGSAPSDFLWMNEMDCIFRGDHSIVPHRSTESEPPNSANAEVEDDTYFDASPQATSTQIDDITVMNYSSSNENDVSRTGEQSTSLECETVAQASTSVANEENMDPADRMALIRRRKQRSPAANKLDNTLNQFFVWIKEANNQNQKVFERAVERVGKIIENAVAAIDKPGVSVNNNEEQGKCDLKNNTTQTDGNVTVIDDNVTLPIAAASPSKITDEPVLLDNSMDKSTDCDSLSEMSGHNSDSLISPIESCRKRKSKMNNTVETSFNDKFGISKRFRTVKAPDMRTHKNVTGTSNINKRPSRMKSNKGGENRARDPYVIVKSEIKTKRKEKAVTPPKRIRKAKLVFTPE